MKKIVIISLIVLISLLGGVFIYLNYIYIPKHLKPIVINFLEENLGKNVRVRKAAYFPIKGVLFSDVEILNPDNSLFLSVSTIDLGLKSIPAISNNAFSAKLKLVIKGLVFKQADLEAQGGGKIDIDINIKGKDDVKFSAVVDLADISVKGIKETGEITNIKGRIICSQRDFASENITATIGAQILNIFVKGDYDKKDINIRKFNIDYMKTNLSIKGTVSDFEKPNIALTFDGLIKLENIPDLLSGVQLPALAGDCKITAECKGAMAVINNLIADAKIELNNVAVEKIKVTGLKADIKLRNGKLNLSDLDGDFYSGKITGTAEAEIFSKDLPVKALIDLQGIEIEMLIEDLIGLNMGQGAVRAHVEISGPAVDLNSLKGQGSVELMNGKVKMPSNFSKVANSLNIAKLADMNIEQASATFTLSDGKLQTQDLILSAAEATISGKGYIDLEQYVDFLATIEAGTSVPLPKVRVYDRLEHLKYKMIFPTQDLIKTGIKSLLDKGGDSSAGESEIQNQIKKGLEKLFR